MDQGEWAPAVGEGETGEGGGPEVFGYVPRNPVGKQGKPRPGEVEAVVMREAGQDCQDGSGVAVAAPVGSMGAEGTSAPRGEGQYQGHTVVGQMEARGAAAAWPWSAPLGLGG